MQHVHSVAAAAFFLSCVNLIEILNYFAEYVLKIRYQWRLTAISCTWRHCQRGEPMWHLYWTFYKAITLPPIQSQLQKMKFKHIIDSLRPSNSVKCKICMIQCVFLKPMLSAFFCSMNHFSVWISFTIDRSTIWQHNWGECTRFLFFKGACMPHHCCSSNQVFWTVFFPFVVFFFF